MSRALGVVLLAFCGLAQAQGGTSPEALTVLRRRLTHGDRRVDDSNREAYREIFHLNETEAERIAKLIPKRQILVKKPDLAKVVNLNVDRKGYCLYTNNPHENQKRSEAF